MRSGSVKRMDSGHRDTRTHRLIFGGAYDYLHNAHYLQDNDHRPPKQALSTPRVPHLCPFRIISFTFWRMASISGSAKPVSSVLTPVVFALAPLMALLSWAWLISPASRSYFPPHFTRRRQASR